MSFVRPPVSVILPCFNQANFLGEAIESALTQQGPSVEIVVVDDGSTDATREVARSFREVQYIHQRNRGTAAARNLGLRSSRGEFIVFLDADDRLLPDAVEIGLRELDEHPECGFVHGHIRRIGPDGISLGTPPQECVGDISYLTLLRQNSIWTPGSVMYRREACEEERGFRSRAGGSADVDLNLRIARRRKVRCHGAVVAEYRVYPDSQSGDPGLMLRSAVWARRSQRVALPDGAEFLEALRQGIRAAQRDYGSRLLTRLRTEVAAGHWKRAIRDLWTLVRYDPARVVRLVGSRRA
jgi:glycosyltransferase involved in cell wall biosynthesis